MTGLEIALVVYGGIALIVLARNVFLCQRERTKAMVSFGHVSTFTEYVPLMVKDSFAWPFLLLWHGLAAWLKELE